ncbi:helix-turn-helix domain-containing protein [Heliorestis convoluta]|uniref:Helix-turn-helix domain-containing protein n=1 Tax=Heliorestis convoluta TaxID=356322 RepID=A0A5Q2N1T0_9FIRM|nr:helix-turn-helix domain-containing protein [Heliorestis convoluta]QGG48958.1 helix-turn-helix domain-containing protein [Heliorestis convoluta]
MVKKQTYEPGTFYRGTCFIFQRSRELGLVSDDIAVYCALESRARGGECFPSYETIANDAGLSRRKAILVVKKLVEKNVIKIDKRYNGDGQTSNLYTLIDSSLWGGSAQHAPPSEQHAPPSAQHAPPSEQHALPLVHSVPPPSAQRAPELNEYNNTKVNNKIDDDRALSNSLVDIIEQSFKKSFGQDQDLSKQQANNLALLATKKGIITEDISSIMIECAIAAPKNPARYLLQVLKNWTREKEKRASTLQPTPTKEKLELVSSNTSIDKPKKPSQNPEIEMLTSYYRDKFVKTFKAEPNIGDNDKKIANELLKSRSLEELKKLMDKWFGKKDDIYTWKNGDLYSFSNMINKLLSMPQTPPQPQNYYQKPSGIASTSDQFC